MCDGRRAFTYASTDAGANDADVFRAAIAGDATHTYWRVDWNTLIDAGIPVATWAFDTDADAATAKARGPLTPAGGIGHVKPASR